MKVFSLYTGGKDSTYSIKKALEHGLEVDAIVTFLSENPYSYMFHTINTNWTYLHAISMNIDHYFFKTSGVKEVELEDLDRAFKAMASDGFRGVVVGAIASEYQRSRVARIAERNGLRVYAPLWGYDQKRLLWELLDNKIIYILTSVSAMGLDKKHLGWIVDDEDDVKKLIDISGRYSFNPSGEGGEYETFVIDADIFRYPIDIVEYEKRWMGDSGYLIIKDARLKRT